MEEKGIRQMQTPGIETLLEIYHSMRSNKVRTILSGFGIAWGILILVVLLGAGQGFQDSVMNLFSPYAQKSIYIYGGSTSMKFENIKEGKEIRFNKTFLQQLQNLYPEMEAVSPEISSTLLAQNGDKSGTFKIVGVETDYMQIRILQVKNEGRLFNRMDVENERNVAIIGENTATVLFRKEEALGKKIQINGVFYKVIGVLKNDNLFGSYEINSIYIPFSTYMMNVNSNPEFSAFCLQLTHNTDSKKFEEKLRNYVSNKLQFSTEDKQALYIANFETQTSSFESLFKGIRQVIWGFGTCFLISGVVGVANVMFVIVKERTNEIGIRLAVGATPGSIIQLIILESIIITAVAGLIGLIAGKGILMFINWLLTFSEKNMLLKETIFDYRTAIGALFVLVIAGIISGMFPAIKASTINPIDAIRYENIG